MDDKGNLENKSKKIRTLIEIIVLLVFVFIVYYLFIFYYKKPNNNIIKKEIKTEEMIFRENASKILNKNNENINIKDREKMANVLRNSLK